jgi:hypothetical protein
MVSCWRLASGIAEASARRCRLLSTAATGSIRRSSLRIPLINSGCSASPTSCSPARIRRGISALKSSLGMTLRFGISFSIAGHRGVAQSELAGDACAGESSALSCALESCECHRCFLEQGWAGGGQLDPAARAHEQIGAEPGRQVLDGGGPMGQALEDHTSGNSCAKEACMACGCYL